MGTISSSTGLISGLDIEGLVTKLMAIESKPLTLLKSQIASTQKEQTAYSTLSAQLLAAVSAAKRLAKITSFQVRTAKSSNEDVLTATAKESTPTGAYTFLVKSLASTHQLVSAGFAARDSTTLNAGTLTFKGSGAMVDNSTNLSSLNGGQGIRRGSFRITDRAGGTAKIDLSTAVTVDDVLQAINSQSTAGVTAAIQGDQIVLTDTSGGTTGALSVQDLSGSYAAADLGLSGSAANGVLTGADLVRLTGNTSLSVLNDGLGLRTDGADDDLRFTLSDGRQLNVNLSGKLMPTTRLSVLNDGEGVSSGTIRITNRYGQSALVNIDGSGTVNDVMAAINQAGSTLKIGSSLVSSKLFVSDASGGALSNFKIEDVTGTAAADLGITTSTSGTSVTSGVLYSIDSMGDVMRAIESTEGNAGALTAAVSADGNSLVLTDHTGQGGVTVEALNGSLAARDLGLLGGSTGSTLQGNAILAGLNTVLLSSLNGGQGINAGVMEFTRRDGSTALVDLTGVQTLNDVMSRIEDAGLSASVASGGLGLAITDSSTGSGTFSVRDLSGSAAAQLGLASTGSGKVSSGDLRRQYISQNTLLSDLHQGKGITSGSFTVTAANGATGTVSVATSSKTTLGSVIDSINNLNIGVQARINANGDGLELVDTTGGSGQMMVAESGGGTTAADLGIVGTAKTGTNTIAGSFSAQVTITSGDTLDSLVKKINTADVGITANVLNDGSPSSPYRLVLSASRSGLAGEISYDTGTTGLNLGDMSVAHDALVALGDGSSSNPIVITSSSNSVTGIADGLTLNLTSASTTPVSVTVGEDTAQILSDMNTFIKAFNATMDQIDKFTDYNVDTQEKGVLLGDHTVQAIHDKLFSEITRTVLGTGSNFKSLSQIGITIDSGARLTLDEDKFTTAFKNDPEGVTAFFTKTTTDSAGKVVNKGFGARLSALMSDLTDSSTGLIAEHNKVLQDRVDMFSDRATSMQEMLDKKEARLYAQFQAMETALSKLQTQQTALASLSALASSTSSTTSSSS